MVIFVFLEIALIFAFHSIGKNQVDLAAGDETIIESIPYATFLGAFDHVYTSSLGELGTETYYIDSMSPVLIFLFGFMSFFMTIHMLNMLIAMMGESFAKNNEEGEAKKKISQLEFVVDNWYINPIADKDKIVYIIAARLISHDSDSDERFDALESKMGQMMMHQENMMGEIQSITQRLMQMQSSAS